MGEARGSRRRVRRLEPPGGHRPAAVSEDGVPIADPEVGDGVPAGTMWPEDGAGFEADVYSPAGQLQQNSLLIDRAIRNPAGVWRALRGSWGIPILLGALVLLVLVAVISALL